MRVLSGLRYAEALDLGEAGAVYVFRVEAKRSAKMDDRDRTVYDVDVWAGPKSATQHRACWESAAIAAVGGFAAGNWYVIACLGAVDSKRRKGASYNALAIAELEEGDVRDLAAGKTTPAALADLARKGAGAGGVEVPF